MNIILWQTAIELVNIVCINSDNISIDVAFEHFIYLVVFANFQEYCLDLFEPSGHGRRRKRYVNNNGTATVDAADKYSNSTTNFAKFKENIEYTVIMPEDIYHGTPVAAENNCGTFLALSGVLGCLLFVAALILCYLTSRLQAAIGSKFRTQHDSFGTGRLHPAGQSSKFPVSFSSSSAYSGRLHWQPRRK